MCVTPQGGSGASASLASP